MKKVAIFMEGQGELVFVRQLAFLIFGYEGVSFECFELHANSQRVVPYAHTSSQALIHIQFVNVNNDSSVISAIKEREAGLFKAGFDAVFGLRDMYSEEYSRRSNAVDQTVIQEFVSAHNQVAQQMSRPAQIHFFFAVMELEAWILGMYKLFEKIDSRLTVQYIEEKLEYNLQTLDPQSYFYHPAKNLDDILKLSGSSYNKSLDQMNSIISRIVEEDVASAVENNRCLNFLSFKDTLATYI